MLRDYICCADWILSQPNRQVLMHHLRIKECKQLSGLPVLNGQSSLQSEILYRHVEEAPNLNGGHFFQLPYGIFLYTSHKKILHPPSDKHHVSNINDAAISLSGNVLKVCISCFIKRTGLRNCFQNKIMQNVQYLP